MALLVRGVLRPELTSVPRLQPMALSPPKLARGLSVCKPNGPGLPPSWAVGPCQKRKLDQSCGTVFSALLRPAAEVESWKFQEAVRVRMGPKPTYELCIPLLGLVQSSRSSERTSTAVTSHLHLEEPHEQHSKFGLHLVLHCRC